MHKVFIDSDIVLDVLAQRENFYTPAAKLFTLIDRGEIEGYISPIVFANIHYVLTKMTSKEFSLRSLRNLKSLLSILPVNDKIIEASLESGFNDFEDAIQYNTAKENEIRFLITRNKKDYKKSIYF